MNTRKSILLSAVAVAVALAAPGFSFAEPLWQSAKGGDSGGIVLQDFKSTKSRAEVLQELEAARQDGSLLSTSELERGLTVSAKKTAKMGEMREPVQNKQFTMSADDKQSASELYRGR